MTGWSKRVDGSGLKCPSLLDSELGVKGSGKEVEGETINTETGILFTRFVTHLLEEAHGPRCFRPIPPMLGNEKPVDLFKLYVAVRERGGYGKVSKNGLWGVVAKECGFDFPYGLPLKLVYAKYLDFLDRWLQDYIKDKELKSEARNINMDIGGMDMEPIFMNMIGNCLEVDSDKEIINADLKTSNALEKDLVGCANEQSVTVKNGNDSESNLLKEDNLSRKRKQESCMDMLDWALMVAKDPCDPSIGQLPDIPKWKSYGTDMMWKQVLLLRESMLLKRNTDSRYQYSVLQKSQKMHPDMYEDRIPHADRVRSSQRILFAKEESFKKKRTHLVSGPSSATAAAQSDDDRSDTQTDSTEDSDVGRWWNQQRRKRTPVGKNFQTDIPEWTGEITESDSKWLGTQIWPLPKGEKREALIERDPIGKGRQDICGCQNPGSYECVKFHIVEKMSKLKCELGSAFYLWKLDCAGEEVATLWTKEEEKKFEDIVKLGSAPENKSFWDEIFKQFPMKSRDSLVSYHFNVFLLRRRAHQNRLTPTEIDSDDDDEQYGPRANSFGREATQPSNSIFCSPKK